MCMPSKISLKKDKLLNLKINSLYFDPFKPLSNSKKYSIFSKGKQFNDREFYNNTNINTQINILQSSANISSFLTSINSKFPIKTSPNEILPVINYCDEGKKKQSPSQNKKCNSIFEKEKLLLKKIFPENILLRQRYKMFNNSLNLENVENEEQLELKFRKENKRKNVREILEKYKNNREILKKKATDIKQKVIFMQGITDYVFPRIMTKKVKIGDKKMNEEEKEKLKMRNIRSLSDEHFNNKYSINSKRWNGLNNSILIAQSKDMQVFVI